MLPRSLWLMFGHKTRMVERADALPGRTAAMPVPAEHYENRHPLTGPWPAGFDVKTVKASEPAAVAKLYAKIVAGKPPAKLEPYKSTIPGTDVSFSMVPIPLCTSSRERLEMSSSTLAVSATRWIEVTI